MTALGQAMSQRLVGRLLMQYGEVGTFRRATESQAANRSTVRSWDDVAASIGLKLLIEPLNVYAAQKIFGQETEARFRAHLALEADVLMGDGLVMTAGQLAGTAYRVVERLPHVLGQVLILGLAQTKPGESFD